MSTWRILCGDVRERLAELPAGSVRCCVTSPPYWGLRDYGHAGQLGLEATPDLYTTALVEVFRAVGRVLADDGTIWLNLGDSYAGSGKGGNNRGSQSVGVLYETGRTAREAAVTNVTRLTFPGQGIKAKDLVGIPWMVAFALRVDGWYLRSDIIWSKPNPMPESVTDRPTKAHEYIFLLSKSARYFYDSAAIREPFTESTLPRMDRGQSGRKYGEGAPGQTPHSITQKRDKTRGHGRRHAGFNDRWDGMDKAEQLQGGANKRSVWNVATHPYPDAHFATFPEALIEPCILAGSAHGDMILDPFTGSGTTGAVAIRHQRSFVGVELNPAYVQLARTRIGNVAPLLASEIA